VDEKEINCMSDDNPFISDDPDVPPVNDQSGSALRKFAEDQKNLVKQLQQQLAETQKQLASRAAAEVFTTLGINEKVRKFYTGDPTKEAIEAWWKENAEVFGVDPGVGNDPTLNDAQQQHQQDIQNVQQAAQLGQDRSGAVSRETMAEARKGLLSQGRDVTDLNAALAKMGVPDLPFMAPQF
jgi:ferritin-like metal-binding protein YciE